MIPLFEQYPKLREGLPRAPLGQWPTPVESMSNIEGQMDVGGLYVKRDDLSNITYGGNKVRNLEFLLGRALRDGRKAVLIFGTAGSNQGVATAIFAKQTGLQSISMLLPQPNAHYVRRNLLRSYRDSAELHYGRTTIGIVFSTLYQIAHHRLTQGMAPQLIPPGGSSPTGMVGFVNAALELKQQVDAGLLPEPDYLYAPLGTMGTVIGLLLGFKVAGLRTHVMAVRVTAPQYSSVRKASRLFGKTNALLHKADPTFPLIPFPESQFTLRHDFYGEEYALYTKESVGAVRDVKETEGIQFEGTYTGKAFAALEADAAAGRLAGKTVLFWHTANSLDFTKAIEGMDFHELPRGFHRYFEQDVQPLDRQPLDSPPPPTGK